MYSLGGPRGACPRQGVMGRACLRRGLHGTELSEATGARMAPTELEPEKLVMSGGFKDFTCLKLEIRLEC